MGVLTQNKTIQYSDIKTKVKRHFAIIGKRLEDKQGNLLFAGATLSSAEEQILKDYLNEATQVFVGNFAPITANYNEGDSEVQFDFTRNRVDASKANAFAGNFESFVVDYIANAVLAMNYPDQAKKYEADMQNHLQAATRLIYSKNAPEASHYTMGDMTGKVILGNKPVAL